MQLYEKTMQGNRVRYVEYVPKPYPHPEIERSKMVTLLATLTMSMLMSVEDQLPKHARMAREIRNVENAVRNLARMVGKPLDEELVNAGVDGWNSAIQTMQSRLMGESRNDI